MQYVERKSSLDEEWIWRLVNMKTEESDNSITHSEIRTLTARGKGHKFSPTNLYFYSNSSTQWDQEAGASINQY